MYYMRPFTVLSGCLRHFHLFVCLFWRKRLYCAAPSYGRCGSQEETSFLCIIHWLGSSVPVHNCTHSEDEGDVSGCDGDFLLGGTPLTTVNGVSQFQPEWICWEPCVEWVRQPPDDAITDMSYFPFYRYAMTFEEFVPAFSSGLPVTGVEWQYWLVFVLMNRSIALWDWCLSANWDMQMINPDHSVTWRVLLHLVSVVWLESPWYMDI